MTKSKRNLFISLLCLATVLVACAEDPDTPPVQQDTPETVEQQPATEPVETEPVLEGRTGAKDNLPEGLTFNGETIHLFHRADFEELVNGDSEGDTLDYALYNRNAAVSERLDVVLDYYTPSDDSPGAASQSILAGDDSMDVILHTEWKMVGLMADGAFLNVANQQYLDLTQPWWLPNVTSELNFSTKITNLFTGEMLTDNIGFMSAMYVNKDLYNSVIASVDGNIDVFYQMVLDGNWTHSKLFEYTELAYADLNGNGKPTAAKDQYGFEADFWSSVDNLTFSTDITYGYRDEEGFPVLNLNTPRMITLVETLDRLYYENQGMLFTSEEDLVPNFVSGRVLFMGHRLHTAMDGNMRETTIDYGIIPYPKLDETQQSYVALIHNASPVIAIPVTCKRLDMVCATLEALSSESYRNVTPIYYESALKNKYSRDDVSSQMIDLIYEGARKEVIYDLGPEGVGQITRKLIENRVPFASFYQANESKYIAGMEDLIAKYRDLE